MCNQACQQWHRILSDHRVLCTVFGERRAQADPRPKFRCTFIPRPRRAWDRSHAFWLNFIPRPRQAWVRSRETMMDFIPPQSSGSGFDRRVFESRSMPTHCRSPGALYSDVYGPVPHIPAFGVSEYHFRCAKTVLNSRTRL
jgi:hypothetical protein